MISQEKQNKLNIFIKKYNLLDIRETLERLLDEHIRGEDCEGKLGGFLIENKNFTFDEAIDLEIKFYKEVLDLEEVKEKDSTKKEDTELVEEIIKKCNLPIEDSINIERSEKFIDLFVSGKYNQDQLFDYLTRQEKVGGVDLNIYQAECFVNEVKKIKEKKELKEKQKKEEKEKSKIKAEEAEENIIRDIKIDLTKEDIERRLRNIIRSYFKGIRTKVEVKVVLKRDQVIGGLGLKEGEAQDFLKRLEEQKSLIDEESLKNISISEEKQEEKQTEKIKLDKDKENQIIEKETISQFKEQEEPKEEKETKPENQPKSIYKPKKVEINPQEITEKLKEPEPKIEESKPQPEVSLKEEKKEKIKESEPEPEIEKEFPSSYMKPSQKKGPGLDLQSEIESQLQFQTQQDSEKPEESEQPEFKIDSNLEPEENIEFKNKPDSDSEEIEKQEEQSKPESEPKLESETKPEPEPEPEPEPQPEIKLEEEKKEQKEEKRVDNISIHRPTVNQGGFQEIKKEPRTYGPVEELKTLTLVDWRRWGNPKERSQTIKDKIDLLAEESLVKKAEGIKAWKSSEVNQLYLEIGAQSIDEGKAITDIIKQRKNQNKEFLTEEEFNAIVELNQQLRF